MTWNMADLLELVSDTVPDRECLVSGGRRLTYRELEERSNRLAHHLADQGVGKDSHIGIYAYNCTEWMEAFVAAMKLRAAAVNVNFRYVEDELRYLFKDADLVAVVHGPEFDPPFDGPTLEIGADYEAALASASPERGFGARADDDRYILYTGGTTGMPKGVVWRHEDVFFALGGGIDVVAGTRVNRPEAMVEKGLAQGQVTSLPIAPLMHGATQWAVMGGSFIGNRVILVSRFDPHNVWQLIEKEQVNVLMVTGDAMARPLVEALEAPDSGYDVSSLLAVVSTAAIFSPTVKEAFFKRLPNLVITDAIGASETGS